MIVPPGIAALPRFGLLDGASPIAPLRRFSAALGGGAEVWIKREDLLPLAFGGNKLRNLEFLAVHDLFLTETARYADVVIPGASFAEKDGTYVNTERRVQLAHLALLLDHGEQPVLHHRHPGGVIAAVLQAAQALHEQRQGLAMADVADDAAHQRDPSAVDDPADLPKGPRGRGEPALAQLGGDGGVDLRVAAAEPQEGGVPAADKALRALGKVAEHIIDNPPRLGRIERAGPRHMGHEVVQIARHGGIVWLRHERSTTRVPDFGQASVSTEHTKIFVYSSVFLEI